MSTPRAVFASPAATRALMHGRIGAVQLVLSGGAYLTLGEDWLFVVAPEAQRHGPLSLAVQGTDKLRLTPGMPVRVGRRGLVVGVIAISLERMRERPLPVVGRAPVAQSRAIMRAAEAAVAELGPVPAQLRRGLDALTAGALAEAAARLAGVGEGLTPAGDDVLAGYAGWQAAGGDPQRRRQSDSFDAGAALSTLAVDRCSPLGLAYLRCAERAELPAGAAQLVIAIRRGSPSDARAAVHGLRGWGASSGLALGRGVAAAAISAGAEQRAVNGG